MTEPETLQGGREPRPAHPHRVARLTVAGLLLVSLVGIAVVVDHGARQRDTRRVTACVVDARGAVSYTSARVDAIVNYVRPALDSGPPPALRRRLLHLVSVSVAPTVPIARRARERCSHTRVMVVHPGLRAVRSDCLRLLGRDLTYLQEVLADGSRAQAARSLPPGRCRAP